jgi:hypothetical protein
MKILSRIILFLIPAGLIISSCEGPMGKSSQDTCMECHNRQVVDLKRAQFEFSQHFQGETFEQGSRTACAPCHSSEGFLFVVENNTPATDYVVDAATASLPGRIDCITCHNEIHTTFTFDDFELTTTEPVPMVMWGGTKTIDISNESANLCIKCHQPRPVTGTAGVINYAALVSAPDAAYNMSTLNYRAGVHYGTEGAMFAGEGGIEFGTGYDREHPHNTAASCATCHMAEPEALSGDHSFIVNFKGCNTTGCHTNMSATNPGYTALVEDFAAQLEALADEINAIGGGNNLLQRDPVDNEYHGYLDIFDRTANPTGYWGAAGNPAFPALTNKQLGAILNFQLLNRDGSNGIHNPGYMMQLLDNTIEAL